MHTEHAIGRFLTWKPCSRVPCDGYRSGNQMTLNPYQPIATPNAGVRVGQTPLGSARITGLIVSVLPAINEAAIFWGHTEWRYWGHRETFLLGMKLWIIGMAVNLALFGFLIYAGFNTRISCKMSVIVTLLPAIAFSSMCVIGYRSLYYDMYVLTALILMQFTCLAVFRSSIAGKILVGVACVSGFGIYLFHMMISSLVT
jgi:hypothetical protein